MKSKKYLIGLIVGVLLLCLGVGYAAVTSQLIITGTASTADEETLKENLQVYFTEKLDFSSGDLTATATINGDKISASVATSGFSKVGDVVTIVLKISNQSTDYDAGITMNTQSSSTEFNNYFKQSGFFVSSANATSLSDAASKTTGAATIDIAAGGYAYYVYKIELKTLPVEQVTGAEHTITYTVTAK